jgi:peptidoglycan hydrolase CwlO-like protein
MDTHPEQMTTEVNDVELTPVNNVNTDTAKKTKKSKSAATKEDKVTSVKDKLHKTNGVKKTKRSSSRPFRKINAEQLQNRQLLLQKRVDTAQGRLTQMQSKLDGVRFEIERRKNLLNAQVE